MSEPPGSMAALNGVHELTADAAPCSWPVRHADPPSRSWRTRWAPFVCTARSSCPTCAWRAPRIKCLRGIWGLRIWGRVEFQFLPSRIPAQCRVRVRKKM